MTGSQRYIKCINIGIIILQKEEEREMNRQNIWWNSAQNFHKFSEKLWNLSPCT